MEEIYNKTAKLFRCFTKELMEENTAIVDKEMSIKTTYSSLSCKHGAKIIPYIESEAKSNFLAITPFSLFTKDDPILRYLPSVRSSQPSSIIWFEGALIGTKPMDPSNVIDQMFVNYWSRNGRMKEALDYIKNRFGRELPELSCEETASPEYKMEDLFCSICCLFSCGIHKQHNPRIVNYNERPYECICYKRNKMKIKEDKNIYETEDFNNILRRKLSPCVLSLILERKGILKDCKRIPKHGFPTKRISQSKKKVDSKQFYEPCTLCQKCTKGGCECNKMDVYCEEFCGCTSCSNVFFCACGECDEKCPCHENNRECTDLCQCTIKDLNDPVTNLIDLRPVTNLRDLNNPVTTTGYSNNQTTTRCSNRPITDKIRKKVSICKSLKHGLGLFAEEFIPANEFVFEYVGELITDKEAERRGNFYEMNGVSYLFNCAFLNENCLYSVDAFFLGNKTRFINHSSQQFNLKSEILFSHGNVKIVFYSTRDIFKGEEFLFDYQFTEEHKKKHGIVE